MNKLFATLCILFLGCGCKSATGLLSEDTRLLKATITPDGPAILIAELKSGTSLEKLLPLLPSHGVSSMDITCAPEDTSGLAALTSTLTVPVALQVSQSCSSIVLQVEQEQLRWLPRYSWSAVSPEGPNPEASGLSHQTRGHGGPASISQTERCTFHAVIILENLTGQDLYVESLEVLDSQGETVAESTAGIDLHAGQKTVRWWQSGATALPSRVVFGWPDTGRWNALRPCLLEAAGPFVMESNDRALPTVRADTLWLEAEELEIAEERTQCRGGYRCTVNISNNGLREEVVDIIYPDRLPRGARITCSGNLNPLPSRIRLESGGSISLPYKILYDSAQP